MPTQFDNTHVVVVSGGRHIHRDAVHMLEPDTVILAADSGWDRARELGLVPRVLVGDMDSISPDSLRDAERSGVDIVRHPADKDFTDIELALAHAATIGRHITLISGGGGRLDHALGELVALTSPSLSSCTLDAVVGTARVHVVVPGVPRRISARGGTTMSLVVVGEPAVGVSLTGCKWSLSEATLNPYESRGVSNIVVSPPVHVSVKHGKLLVIEPFFFSVDSPAGHQEESTS